MPKRVFIFLDTMPQRQGSGASLRFYSNIRAYLDLGFDVEVVQIATSDDGSKPSEDLSPVVWKRVFEAPAQPSLQGRLLFRAGVPAQASMAYYFAKHFVVLREVKARVRSFPDAVYHLEGESMANVIPWLPKGTHSIWSLHDLPSTVAAATIKIRSEAENRSPTVPEQRELHFAERAERFIAKHAPGIVCIAQHDCDELREVWQCPQAEYLPMSIPGDGAERPHKWLQNGKLNLLHLGRVSHLPSYRSLEFLFRHVFPLLPASTLERISMEVVGTVEPEDERAKTILKLAEPYRNVVFRGFVPDVVPYYQSCDVQAVGSTDASGLRTRTIESFAYGLPVLSTSVGAKGIPGLTPGRELLIEDTPEGFARQLGELLETPELLSVISGQSREFYRSNHARPVIAERLNLYLEKHFRVV
ncbi:MAG TPA: glycosyltransferase family 4 protein [Pyrinomonadaceae bacterium]|nr:glycosyltransferase family 4 protein [Pyrinomonadaceae bacterium]